MYENWHIWGEFLSFFTMTGNDNHLTITVAQKFISEST